jgi:hypothetical protein
MSYYEDKPEFRVRLPKKTVEALNQRITQLFPDQKRSDVFELLFQEIIKETEALLDERRNKETTKKSRIDC